MQIEKSWTAFSKTLASSSGQAKSHTRSLFLLSPECNRVGQWWRHRKDPGGLPLSCHCSATVQRFIHNLTWYPRIQLWPRGHMQPLRGPPRRTIDHGDDLLLRGGTGRATDTCTIRGKIDRCSRKSHDSDRRGSQTTCANQPRFPRRSRFLLPG